MMRRSAASYPPPELLLRPLSAVKTSAQVILVTDARL